MKYVEIIANQSSRNTVEKLAENVDAIDLRFGLAEEGSQQTMRMIVDDDKVQKVLDTLQGLFGAQPSSKVIVLDIEAVVPRSETTDKSKQTVTAVRETLYEDIKKNAHINADYLLLIMLSTVVAAIGLIENNVAVLIGAMVIAPLLGPNLALSLAAALGNINLIKDALVTLVVGTSLAIGIGFITGYLWPEPLTSDELLIRTSVGVDAAALALASGAAAALSICTGLSSVLVGVMVAVALLPPAVTLGLMLGQMEYQYALGALVLLAINIICVNLSSKLVFLFKKIEPRRIEKQRPAKRMLVTAICAWAALLVSLVLYVVK